MILTDHLPRRYQIFLSSTFLDLQKEREKVSEALASDNHIVEGMELFPASNQKQWDVITERIDRSDVYLLIIGDKYGSTTDQAHKWKLELAKDGEVVSYTQLEYRYAKTRRLPILALIKVTPKKEVVDETDVAKQERIKEELAVAAFIKEVQNGGITTDYWHDAAELAVDVMRAVNNQITSEGFTAGHGWVRADSLHHPIDHDNKAVFLASKTQYAKFVAHAHKHPGRAPLYRKYIHRLQKEFDVWDEYNTVTVNCFSHCLNAFKFYTRTDGDAVDFSVLMPYVDKLTFSDVKEGVRDTVFNPTIEAPSNVYAVATSYINGFQDGNTDLATKATHHTRVLRFIADFTSIPDHQRRFQLLRCVQVDPQAMELNITKEVRSIQPGVYLIERINVPKDHVIKFNFKVLP